MGVHFRRGFLPATILLILLIDERIRHPRDVVADHAGQRLLGGLFAVVARQVVGFLHPVGEEFSRDALGVFFLSRERRTIVEILVEKVFQTPTLLFDRRAERRQALGVTPNIFQRTHAGRFPTLRRVRNQVSDKSIENALKRLVKNQLLGDVGVLVLGQPKMALKQINAIRNLLDREQPRFVAIVEIGGVVGNLVGKVDKLR